MQILPCLAHILPLERLVFVATTATAAQHQLLLILLSHSCIPLDDENDDDDDVADVKGYHLYSAI